jgi:hypothetical protein
MGQTNKGSVQLASNAGAGNTTAKQWFGGKGCLIGSATWGGGSAKLQTQAANGTWVDIPSTTLSADGTLNVDLPRGTIRAVIATASAVYLDLVHEPI